MTHDRLRIAMLCPGFDRVSRGVETFTGELARRIIQLRPTWRVDIFCRGESTPISNGIRLIHVPALDRGGRLATLYAQAGHRLGLFLRTRIDAECLSFTLSLSPRLLRADYDVVFNQAGPFAGRLLQAKRRMDGTPFVHKTASGYGELEALMARQKPNAVVATSPYVKDWLECLQPALDIECIPNAVDHSIFRPYSPDEIAEARNGSKALDLPRPIILFVGAMEPMKRPKLAIEAAHQAGVSLVMIGSGRLSRDIIHVGKDALGSRFAHIPHVTREQIALYYNACDLFTLPSEEPFGIAFLEAMACNKPVLGNASPVQDWIFADAGATCDCADPDVYAGAIKRMLETDFGDRPVKRSRDFGWSEVAPKYEALFTRIARRQD